MKWRRKPAGLARRGGPCTTKGLVLLGLLFLASGCHSLKLLPTPAEKLDKQETELALGTPSRRSFRVPPFVFLADFDVQPDLPVFRELADLNEQVCHELQLPSANTPVLVHVFEDRERYELFMHTRYPDLPKRRAFFVAQPHRVGGGEDLLVYTYWGERVREDLRHELTHALLHSVLKDVPLWLDEGLAEYFELPPDRQGVNAHHLELVRTSLNGPFKPDLVHLEQLTQVQQMTPTEYREAWAWVHLMLRDQPEGKTVLTAYLQQLRTNPNPGSLETRLAKVYPDLEEALTRHLNRYDVGKVAGPPAQQ